MENGGSLYDGRLYGKGYESNYLPISTTKKIRETFKVLTSVTVLLILKKKKKEKKEKKKAAPGVGTKTVPSGVASSGW